MTWRPATHHSQHPTGPKLALTRCQLLWVVLPLLDGLAYNPPSTTPTRPTTQPPNSTPTTPPSTDPPSTPTTPGAVQLARVLRHRRHRPQRRHGGAHRAAGEPRHRPPQQGARRRGVPWAVPRRAGRGPGQPVVVAPSNWWRLGKGGSPGKLINLWLRRMVNDGLVIDFVMVTVFFDG